VGSTSSTPAFDLVRDRVVFAVFAAVALVVLVAVVLAAPAALVASDLVVFFVPVAAVFFVAVAFFVPVVAAAFLVVLVVAFAVVAAVVLAAAVVVAAAALVLLPDALLRVVPAVAFTLSSAGFVARVRFFVAGLVSASTVAVAVFLARLRVVFGACSELEPEVTAVSPRIWAQNTPLRSRGVIKAIFPRPPLTLKRDCLRVLPHPRPS
jgi:hypothetical protein